MRNLLFLFFTDLIFILLYFLFIRDIGMLTGLSSGLVDFLTVIALIVVNIDIFWRDVIRGGVRNEDSTNYQYFIDIFDIHILVTPLGIEFCTLYGYIGCNVLTLMGSYCIFK